jgi:hypothetical protein
MSSENKRILAASAENILSMKKVKAGSQITFGVEGDVLMQIYSGKLIATLLLIDFEQFKEMKTKMEKGE